MVPTKLAFRGSAFFLAVRELMQADRGFFHGVDDDLHYVCADATFYRLQVFLRPPARTFTASASSADPAIRAIASGQVFGRAIDDYGWTAPKQVAWQGQVIVDGAVLAGGDGQPAENFHYINQWPGTGPGAIGFGRGEPGDASPPVQAAIGRLLPLIRNGNATPAATLGDWSSTFGGVGKCVYGVCRAQGIVFFLVQEHHPARFVGGLTVPELIDRMINAGVDAAVMGDGSNTVGLVVDGHTDVAPLFYKDNSIPCGPALRLHGMALLPSAKLTLRESTDPRITGALTLTAVEGRIRLAGPGMAVQLTDLGNPSTGTRAQLLADLGVNLPLTFAAEQAPRPPGVAVELTGTRSNLTLLHAPERTWDGTFTGLLTVQTAQGSVMYDVYWDVEDLP